jgi:hypothetical protein
MRRPGNTSDKGATPKKHINLEGNESEKYSSSFYPPMYANYYSPDIGNRSRSNHEKHRRYLFVRLFPLPFVVARRGQFGQAFLECVGRWQHRLT